jgi:RHS repeat-associated protein
VSSWRATSHSYDSFGNQTSTTDPGGHTTTFEYSQCTSGNLSATNYAITGFREEKTWNCSIGAPLTSKDLNLQVASFEYNDTLFLRLTKVNKPDTGYVTLAYNDTTRVVTATELVNNGAATTLSAQHNFDGLGRLTESSILGDTCGAIKSNTVYDSVGRISQVSNPYCLQSESTYGLTTYQYDGLDRKNLLIPPDGTVSSDNVSTVFTGNCALVTDQAGKLRKSCSDALGRVIEVDEPNGVFGPATSGTGSLTVSGTEQSTQSTSSGTPGTATVSISGTEQSGTFTNPIGDCAPHVLCYDDGSVSITVNGQSVSASYGQGATASSVAGALAARVNSSSSYATATVSGTVITLTARTAGAGTNYTLAVATVWDSDFSHASFTPTKSGATLTGGTNGTTTTVYDSGNVSVTVSGITATINYSQTVNNTAALVTSALASAINGNSSYPVRASASGTTLALTAKQTGAATNYTVSSASTTTQGTYFAHPSFSSPSTTLTGGSDASGGLATPWVTLYSYDVLNNLTCVVQKGTDATAFTNCASALSTWRPRSATYNSLSQLVSSTNPETGTLSYTYNLDGNVLTRVAPAPNQSGALTVTTTYSYDAMHRPTGKTYSNGELSVTYSYDQTNCLGLAACYNKGHRTGMTDAAGSESWAYDLMGRAVKEQRVTNGVTKTTTYTYYVDGSVASIIYPSGRTMTYGYDAVTRPVSAVDSANSINYVTAALYSPAGGLASLQNDAALVSKFFYNKRLQPCRISVKKSGTSPSQCSDAVNLGNILDFTYDYNLGAADNGEVKQIANNRNPSRTQNFTYDSLNRILTASTQATTGTYAWGLQFGYDIWGDLLTSTLTQGSAPILTVSADTNNRISGFCYDAAGNLLGQTAPPCPSPTYTYDAENRIKTTAGVTYTYDGDGNRVKKSNGKLYWYGSGSVILDESDATGNITNEYIFFGGKRLARRVVSSSQVQYYFADHLGSSRVVTDASGNILDDADFYPFGGERTYISTSGNAYKFTGKERDTESGLDDFGARYFTSQYGRFMTPDWSASPVLVPYGDLGNPQTFNLYSYVANNPINGVDPEGHFRLDPGTENYNDTDTGDPMYGKAVTSEQAKDQAQNTTTQQRQEVLVGATTFNGQAAVAASLIQSTTTTDAKGNTTTSVTITSQFYSNEKGKEGTYLGSTKTTDSWKTDKDGDNSDVHHSDSSVDRKSATEAIGTGNVARAQTAAAAPNRTHYFWSAVGKETRNHPWRQVERSAGVAGLAGCLVIPGCAAGAGGALAGGTGVVGGAADLIESWTHWRED